MKLIEFFREYPKVAIAFSGGVDSSYLLYAALESGVDATAYYVNSDFQPKFELEDAKRLANQLGARLEIIELDVLSHDEIAKNPSNRCYYCKNAIFKEIINRAKKDGYSVIIDGTNASDEVSDRPGMKALQELSVLSPLRLSGITKSEVRQLSKEAGLFTWDKPAYACLATRIQPETEITKEMLVKTEQSEDFLSSIGFTDFRVRMIGNSAKIQIPEAQLSDLIKKRSEILKELSKYYDSVMLDLEVR